jgi:transcriptional regulator with XRE-family HTH domain
MNGFHRPNPVFSEDYAVIRNALLEARQRAGMTQRDLASRLGKTASHIALIETGQRRVDTLEFYLIARALGIDPSGLFQTIVADLAALDQSSAADVANDLESLGAQPASSSALDGCSRSVAQAERS